MLDLLQYIGLLTRGELNKLLRRKRGKAMKIILLSHAQRNIEDASDCLPNWCPPTGECMPDKVCAPDHWCPPDSSCHPDCSPNTCEMKDIESL